jgi:hypothetical protein
VNTGPRPYPAIVKEGGPNELQDLIKRSHVVSLSPAENARLNVLTFTPDPSLERAWTIRRNHPDLAHLITSDLASVADIYAARRAAAVEAGVIPAEPDARIVAGLDSMATEYAATAGDPYADMDTRHRAAFAAAIQAGDFAAAVKEWAAWLKEHAERNAYAKRKAAAIAASGRHTFADVRFAPSFIPELEAAVGGGTIAETMPIIQR